MFTRLILICALSAAGCSGLTWKKVVKPDSPPGMEAIGVLGAEQETVLSISKLPPNEAETAGKLIPGDFVAIQVYKQPTLSIRLIIPLSGEVNYPVIGTVQLAGKTISEVEADIESRLEEKMLSHARVTVLIQQHNKRSVYVLGSVIKPGEYEIHFGKSLSLLQAVSKAGGFREDADRNNILFIRDNKGKRATYRIAYSEIVENGGLEKDVILHDGDILIIQERSKVYVLGKVNAPGGFALPPGQKLTLTKTISLAKGFNSLAAQNRTTIIRELPDGTTHIFRINVGNIFDGTLRDPIILPGDTVLVPESFF